MNASAEKCRRAIERLGDGQDGTKEEKEATSYWLRARS